MDIETHTVTTTTVIEKPLLWWHDCAFNFCHGNTVPKALSRIRTEGQFKSSEVVSPDCMDPFTDFLFFATLKDKILHIVKFILFPTFKATRVMEDKSWIATKYELILDVMFTSLIKSIVISIETN